MRVHAAEKKIDSRRERNCSVCGISVESISREFLSAATYALGENVVLLHVRSVRENYMDVPNNSATLSNPIGNRYSRNIYFLIYI